ncbi:MAG: hypothetical protein LH629_15010, partial [Ignavibacteria bacterium]|nr:hypothetical protein [Ignavibacteria bacterium]
MSSSSIGLCSGYWYDPGGAPNPYANNSNITQSLYSSTGQCIKITFISFNVESAGDTLYVYDGPNSTFPLIGKYTGTFIPSAITST